MGRKRIRPPDDEKDRAREVEGGKKRSAKRKRLSPCEDGQKIKKKEQRTENLTRPERRINSEVSEIESRKADKKRKPKGKSSKISGLKHIQKDSKDSSRNRKRKHNKRRKNKLSRASRRSANNSKRRDKEDEIIDSSWAEEMKEPMTLSRSPTRPQTEKSSIHRRSEEDYSDEMTGERRVENSVDMSLMSRRMMVPKKANMNNIETSTDGSRLAGSYERFKLKTESILAEKLKGLIGSFKNCTEQICKSSRNQTKEYEKRLIDHVPKVVDKENNIASMAYRDKISKSRALLRRCEILEKQLASTKTRSARLAKKARFLETAERKHKALKGEYESVCGHNIALQTELSEVKLKFHEQLADKTREISTLKDVHSSLMTKAKEFRVDTEKSQEAHRVKYDSQLNKIREEHSKEIGRLQVQCTELKISNLDLTQKNRDLEKILKENKIEPLVTTAAMTPDRRTVPQQSIITAQSFAGERGVTTPHSGQRGESVRKQSLVSGSATLISLLKADIASLRVSLESKTTQLCELREIYNIYVILTGLRITKNELYFECLAQNTEARIKFLFSLICHDNGSSLQYESNAWEADYKCPGFLNECSGQFFESKVAPLFLKNVIKEVFSPDIPICEPVVA